MSVDAAGEGDLNTIFAEAGEFGLYQIAIFLLISIPNALSVTFIINYMFAANTLDYRQGIFSICVVNFLIANIQVQCFD